MSIGPRGPTVMTAVLLQMGAPSPVVITSRYRGGGYGLQFVFITMTVFSRTEEV